MSLGIINGAAESREEAKRQALSGNYDTAEIYFDGVLDQMTRFFSFSFFELFL